MTFTPAYAVGPVADILAIVILLVSVREILRQDFSRFHDVKEGLIGVEAIYGFIFVLDLLRNLFIESWSVQVYTLIGGALVFWGAVVLSYVAYAIYVRPEEGTFSARVRALLSTRLRPHGLAIGGLTVYVAAMTLFLWIVRPYRIVEVVNAAGVKLDAPAFGDPLIVLAGALLVFFIAYPVQALLRSRRTAADTDVRRAMAILPISWTIIGNIFLISNGLLVFAGFDIVPFGFVGIAATIAWASTIFRKASVSGFFSPSQTTSPVSPSFPFTSRIKGSPAAPLAHSVLLNFDPSSDYETAVRDFALEELSNGRVVFVLTYTGSPLALSLERSADVRYLVLTGKVTSPYEIIDSHEMLIPQGDMTVILNTLGKTLESPGATSKAFVFDNLSNLIVDFGFESAYKFMKQMNEVVDRTGAVSLFLMIDGAQDERTNKVMESLFGTALSYDSSGLKLLRRPS
jgi:hypothetical protein